MAHVKKGFGRSYNSLGKATQFSMDQEFKVFRVFADGISDAIDAYGHQVEFLVNNEYFGENPVVFACEIGNFDGWPGVGYYFTKNGRDEKFSQMASEAAQELFGR